MKYLLIGGAALMLTLVLSKLVLPSFDPYAPEPKPHESNAEQLIHMGRSLYAMHCTSCHGQQGDGNNGKAQNHTYRISKESVLHVIQNGSNHFTTRYPAGMLAGLLKGQEAEAVARFVSDGMRTKAPAAWSACASCHDNTGVGIPFVAPNIKAYSDTLVMTVLNHGKKGAIGTMPSFKGRLSEIQMKGLAHYIRSIQKR